MASLPHYPTFAELKNATTFDRIELYNYNIYGQKIPEQYVDLDGKMKDAYQDIDCKIQIVKILKQSPIKYDADYGCYIVRVKYNYYLSSKYNAITDKLEEPDEIWDIEDELWFDFHNKEWINSIIWEEREKNKFIVQHKSPYGPPDHKFKAEKQIKKREENRTRVA